MVRVSPNGHSGFYLTANGGSGPNSLPARIGDRRSVPTESSAGMGVQIAKKVARFPRRSRLLLGQFVSDEKADLHELDRGIEIQGLVHVVARCVIARGNPVLEKLARVYIRVLRF